MAKWIPSQPRGGNQCWFCFTVLFVLGIAVKIYLGKALRRKVGPVHDCFFWPHEPLVCSLVCDHLNDESKNDSGSEQNTMLCNLEHWLAAYCHFAARGWGSIILGCYKAQPGWGTWLKDPLLSCLKENEAWNVAAWRETLRHCGVSDFLSDHHTWKHGWNNSMGSC